MNVDKLGLILTVVTAIVTSMRWVYEYSKKQTWERSRFMLDRLELFFAKTSTKQMHRMLDWNKLFIQYEGLDIKVTDELLYEAFQTHDVKHTFSKEEVILRGIFDEYFDGLTEIAMLSDAGLIDESRARTFLKYWLDIIGGRKMSKPDRLRSQIMRYLEFYGYHRLIEFINGPAKRALIYNLCDKIKNW